MGTDTNQNLETYHFQLSTYLTLSPAVNSYPNATPFLNAKMESIDFKRSGSKLPVDDYPIDSIPLPLIDMANPVQKELDQLRSACQEWGICHIINHSVSEKILEEFSSEVIKLFSLPTNVKLRLLKLGIQETTKYGKTFVINRSPSSMWHEGFSLGTHKELLEHATKFWPPHGNPRFCQIIESYEAEIKRLVEKQLKLMLASVGLTPEDIDWAEIENKEQPFGQHMSFHQHLNSYPPCPTQTHAMGFRAHTHTCFIAVLNSVNNVSGLQVLHKDKWVMVDPIPGALIVNCGDLLHILTNGQFMAAIHRVIPLEDKHRCSAVAFYGPPYDAPFSPMSKLVELGHQPLFQPKTFTELLKCKYGGVVVMPPYVPLDLVNNNKNVDDE